MVYNDLKHSIIATCVAEIITLPILTAKTNYQNSRSTSAISTIKSLYNKNGISIFYKASFAAISSQVISTSSKFTLYSFLKEKKYIDNNVANGALSGLLSTIVTHPIDTIKIHNQMDKPFIPEFRKIGFLLLYRGYTKSLSKVIVASSLFFPLYDYFKDKFNNPYYASFSSALTSTLIIHPIDYLKTRHIYNMPLYTGLNPAIYYKGISLNLLRAIPHFMIVMSIINYLERCAF